jgi:hypothetical protein
MLMSDRLANPLMNDDVAAAISSSMEVLCELPSGLALTKTRAQPCH